MKYLRAWHHVLIQLVLILILSFISPYHLPKFEDANWDTTLFLTPIGLIKNYTAENETLRSFYMDMGTGNTTLTLTEWPFIALVYALLITNFFFYMRKLKA